MRLGVFHRDILGDHFSTSGASRGVILAPRDHAGGPWEQQDGFEMVAYRILLDFGVIFGPVYITFLSSKILKYRYCFRACFQVICLSMSELKFRRLGFPNQGFRIESIAKNAFSWKLILMNFGIGFYVLLEALGAAFLVFGL